MQGTTRPDIAMATHECARSNNDPHLLHEQAVKRIGRYLLNTRDKGMIYRPDISCMDLPAGMDLAGHGKDSSKYLLKLK